MPTMREEMERDLNDWLKIQTGDHIEEPEAFLIWLRSRGWTRQEPYDSITEPNHPAIAVTPAVALLENALELLRPHMYTKGGDASADGPIRESAKHSTDVAEGEGDQREPSERCQEADGNKKLKSQNSVNGSAPSPEAALRYSLGEPDPGACEYCGGTGKKRILSGRATPDCKYCNGTGNAPWDSAWNAKKRQPDVQTACSPEAIDEVLEADFPEDAIEEELEAVGRGALPPKAFVIREDIREELRTWAHEPHMDDVYVSRLVTAIEEMDNLSAQLAALRSQIKQIRECVEKEGDHARLEKESAASLSIPMNKAYALGGVGVCRTILDEIKRITGRLSHDSRHDSNGSDEPAPVLDQPA